MNLLKVSNCYLTKGGPCAISLMMAPIPTPTSRPILSTPCALHGLDHQRLSSNSLLRIHGTYLEDAVLREGLRDGGDHVESLRAELYKTKLRLLATQLAYEDLAFRIGTCFCPAVPQSRTNLCLGRNDLFTLPQQVQLMVERQIVDDQFADRSRFLTSSASRTKSPPSDPRPPVHKERNATASIAAPKEDELHGIKKLLTTAHNGDVSVRDELKSRVRIAHGTSTVERSDEQKFLVENWRKPRQRKLFVDASRSGIGIVLEDGKWLAWKIIDSHASVPKGLTGLVDTAWAEFTAAEMGVRTLLAANYRYISINLLSDSLSVVNALKTRECKNHRLHSIVQQILALCNGAGLDLQPDRVNGKENPADKPSRGLYPSEDRIFPRPLIPSHLSELIQEVE